MKLSVFVKSIALCTVLFLVSSALAQQKIKGKPDYPLTPPIPGYEMFEYRDKGFASEVFTNLDCIKIKDACDPKFEILKGRLTIEGFVTSRAYYLFDSKARAFSDLEITSNYDNALKAIGSEKIVASSNYVTFHVVEKAGVKNWIHIYVDGKFYYITVVEQKDMTQTITAGKLAEDIGKQGYVALNVNFDNNKAIIKDQDKPTLNEVVKLLKTDVQLKLSVDGHTDNVGNASANKTLSQQRADSIVKYLISNGATAARLVAKGFGSEVPIGDNRTEEGRAKNRRVELVKIK